jgi:hypothetical protein
MRIDRAALLRNLFAVVSCERDQRQAAERAVEAEAWVRLLDQIAEMGQRLAAAPDARELAEQIAQAPDWARIDQLRVPADRSRAEAVALAWTVDPAAAERLLIEYGADCD